MREKSKQGSKLASLITLSTLLTCGLALPIWLMVGIVILIVKKFVPKRTPVYKTIMPSNEFASDWEFKIYDLSADDQDIH